MYVQVIVGILFIFFLKHNSVGFLLAIVLEAIAIANLGSLVAKPLSKVALQVQSLLNNVCRSLRSPLKETNLITKIHSKYLRHLQYFKTLHRVFIYVIGWQVVVFGINIASIVYRKQ